MSAAMTTGLTKEFIEAITTTKQEAAAIGQYIKGVQAFNEGMR